MFIVESEIDRSEQHNPVLRVVVFQTADDQQQFDTRTYSMSLRSVDADMHQWCEQVMVANVTDIVTQVEQGTKANIKKMIAKTFNFLGLDFS